MVKHKNVESKTVAIVRFKQTCHPAPGNQNNSFSLVIALYRGGLNKVTRIVSLYKRDNESRSCVTLSVNNAFIEIELSIEHISFNFESFTSGVYRASTGLWISNVSLNGVKYRGASAPTQKKAIETLFELRKKVYLREIGRLQNVQKPAEGKFKAVYKKQFLGTYDTKT
jgi:hypothetical protein